MGLLFVGAYVAVDFSISYFVGFKWYLVLGDGGHCVGSFDPVILQRIACKYGQTSLWDQVFVR